MSKRKPNMLRLELEAGHASALERVRLAFATAGSIGGIGGAAKILGVPEGTLRDWVSPTARASLPALCAMADEMGLRRSKPTSKRAAQIRRLRAKGLSMREIATQLEISEATVSRELKRVR